MTLKTTGKSRERSFFEKGIEKTEHVPQKERDKTIKTTRDALDFLKSSKKGTEKTLRQEVRKELFSAKKNLLELLEGIRKAQEMQETRPFILSTLLDSPQTTKFLLSLYTRRYKDRDSSNLNLADISTEYLEPSHIKDGVLYMRNVEDSHIFPEVLYLSVETLELVESLCRANLSVYLKAGLDLTNPKKGCLEFIAEQLQGDYRHVLENYRYKLDALEKARVPSQEFQEDIETLIYIGEDYKITRA